MRALITGVTGQDGYYLSQQLLEAGHEVYGMVRWQRGVLRETFAGVRIVEGDMLDQSSLVSVLKTTHPDVVFNLAAITFVGLSWQQPTLMTEVTGLGVLRLLEAIRQVNPEIRLVHASSSEMFGGISPKLTRGVARQMNEVTPMAPRSPYGVAKCFAHHTVVNYRESYGLHCSAAIMFNHESPRRGPEFVTRKVTLGVAAIAAGRERWLRLGRLDTYRDWGWAPDFMRALPLMAARDEPRDYVLATGEAYSVADLCRMAFTVAGFDNWRDYVVHDETLLRPADVEGLLGFPQRAATELGWEPEVMFPEIVRRMVLHDMEAPS